MQCFYLIMFENQQIYFLFNTNNTHLSIDCVITDKVNNFHFAHYLKETLKHSFSAVLPVLSSLLITACMKESSVSVILLVKS